MEPQHTPAQMITEIAFGIEDPQLIAFRFGYSPEDFDALKTQDWFQHAVASKRSELKVSGWTARFRFGCMAEDLMARVYQYAMKSDNMSSILEVAKYAAKLADMEPKNNAPALVGTGFSININLSGSKAANANTTIDMPKTNYQDDDLPPAPSYLAILPFQSLTESNPP